MSLLADLLSKVAPAKTGGDVPPALQRVVLEAGRQRSIRRKMLLVGVVAATLILLGIVAVRFLGDTSHPTLPPRPFVQATRAPATTAVRQSPVLVREVIHHDTGGPQGQERPARSLPPANAPTQGTTKPTVVSTAGKALPRRVMTSQPGEDDLPVRKERSESMDGRKEEIDEALYAARACETSGDRDQALTYYRKVSEMDPRNFIVLNKIAAILIAKGSFKEGGDYARNALALNREHVPSLINLGIAAIQAGNTDGGTALLRKALAFEPANGQALLNLGLAYERDKNYDEAANAYSRLADLRNMNGWLGIGRIAENAGKRDDARRAYREVLASESGDVTSKRLASERLMALER
jgi:Tfp pilus assembly protein PilF